AGSATTLVLPTGTAEPGETLAIVPSKDVQPLPRGPVPGPRAASGRQRAVDVLADEVARVRPAPDTLVARVERLVRALRTSCLARTATIRDLETRALICALLFGDTSELPPDVPDLFVRT